MAARKNHKIKLVIKDPSVQEEGGNTGIAGKNPAGHYYTTVKNRKNNPEKLKLRKYNKVLRKHVVYGESKI